MTRAAAQTISVLLFENFSNHCLANAVEPFRAANTIGRRALYSWEFVSMRGGTVVSSSGLPVETEAWARRRPGGDYLFVMPSYDFEVHSGAAGPLLRSARSRFSLVAGLDTGAWLLAAAGLLRDRRATIHWDEFTRFSEGFPEVIASAERVIVEEDLATCGGATTAMELAIKLIERRHGPMFALEVAALFMHGDGPGADDPFRRMGSERLVRGATALMRRHIEQPLKIPQIARRLGVDPRALEAAFARDLERLPRSVYRTIRLREARRLVEMTRLRVTEIATRCGYQNASALTRAYRAEFGQTPQAHRRAQNAAAQEM